MFIILSNTFRFAVLHIALCDVHQDLVASISCKAWKMTVNKSLLEVPANTFKPNQTYIITLVISAPGRRRRPAFDTQTVCHNVVLVTLFLFYYANYVVRRQQSVRACKSTK